MAICLRRLISPGSSGHSRFRRVMKATTGSTSKSMYFKTASGVRCWSQVPATDPVREKRMEGPKSLQSTYPFLINRAVEKQVPMAAETLLVPKA